MRSKVTKQILVTMKKGLTRKEIVKSIDKQIKTLEKTLKDTEKELKWAQKLPDDPTVGQKLGNHFKYDSEMINENPYLKTDYLTNYNYTIGYCTGHICALKDMRYDLLVTKEQHKKDVIRDKEVKKANKETMKKLKDMCLGKADKPNKNLKKTADNHIKEDVPNEITKKAMKEAENGKVYKVKNATELLQKLKT